MTLDSMESLWGDEFELPKEDTKKILDKIAKPKEVKVTVEKQIKSKKLSIADRLNIITAEVNRVLGKQKDNILVVKDRETLTNYFDKAISNGVMDVDTETNNSLDPITCKLMGPCFYTPGEKQVYVPINHINYETGERLDWQLTEQDIKEELQRLVDNNVKIIMHNGSFDYQVIKCTCGIDLPLYWDTMIAARLLNENERSAGLKQQYIDKIDPDQEKYNIEHLFDGLEYAIVDPDIFAMYAATDALMTHKLYEWQKERFDKPEMARLFKLFQNVEVPIVTVSAKMELAGVKIDKEFAGRLSNKYHKLIEECDQKTLDELKSLQPKIDAWKLTPEANEHSIKNGKEGKSKAEQLEEPVNLASPSQLAILLYDILKVPVVSKKAPRGTGEDELKSIYEKTNLNLCNLILERRGLLKLINTYIDKLPEVANPKDGKIHCHFKQLGTDTGRFCSSDPNLQNIPAHEKSIRMMFTADEGKVLVGSDYSAQEPRLTAFYAQDKAMLSAYTEGKDLYAVIASSMYNNDYKDNLEFYPEGTEIDFEGKKVICGNKTHLNKAGKARRFEAKSVLIGLLYGRGAASIAEQINANRKDPNNICTREDAQDIVNKFFKSFPSVKRWIDETQNNARKNGYVEDWYGRVRRLPDINLPKYSVKQDKATYSDFNPIIGCEDRVDNTLVEKYTKALNNVRSKRDYEDIQRRAAIEGISIHDNSGFISQAERQSVNARVQGGAATLTKLAMIAIDNDKRLKELGFELLITVHDEVIGQCPEENADEVAERLPQIMIDTAKPYLNVPMKCDPSVVKAWYEDENQNALETEYKKYVEKGMTHEDAYNKLVKGHPEMLEDQLHTIITNLTK